MESMRLYGCKAKDIVEVDFGSAWDIVNPGTAETWNERGPPTIPDWLRSADFTIPVPLGKRMQRPEKEVDVMLLIPHWSRTVRVHIKPNRLPEGWGLYQLEEDASPSLWQLFKNYRNLIFLVPLGVIYPYVPYVREDFINSGCIDQDIRKSGWPQDPPFRDHTVYYAPLTVGREKCYLDMLYPEERVPYIP